MRPLFVRARRWLFPAAIEVNLKQDKERLKVEEGNNTFHSSRALAAGKVLGIGSSPSHPRAN